MSPTSPPPLGPREAALAQVLSRGDLSDSLAALDEYAWRSLLSGLRVREYCAAASHAVRNAPSTGIRFALVHSSTRLLFPFALPAGAPAPPAPSSFIPPHAFPHLTRRQLVEAFVRLTRENRAPGVVEACVHELALEYVGRRWRAEGGVIESIARKLAEVELEVIQTEPFASTTVAAALSEFRFQLGLVNVVHLIGRLGQQGTTRSTADATQLLCAWAVRRLNTGLDPQSVADNLAAMRERLPVPAGDVLPDVLCHFCLDDRPTHSHITAADDGRTRARTLSRLSLRSAKRRTLPIPQWLSPRPTPILKLPPFEIERRPSLPALLLPSTPPRSHNAETTSRFGTPTSDTSSPCSTPGAFETTVFSIASLPHFPTRQSSPLSPSSSADINSLGLCGWDHDRIALVDQLLPLRYRLGPDADSWYLGTGRDKAADFLISVEATGEADPEVIAQLRYAFGLSVVVIPVARTPSPPASMELHQRDVSFDLEQYLDDINPLGEDGKSTPGTSPCRSVSSTSPIIDMYSGKSTPGLSPLSKSSSQSMPLVELYTTGSSISTLSSVLTSDSTATVTSLSDSISVSAFSIHEARREVPKSAKATSYRIPDRTVVEAIDDADFPALLPPLSYPRHAKSMPNVNDSYTRMPNRKRRPRSTKDFRLLPAFELEAQRMEVEHRSVSDSGHARLERSSTLVKGYTFPPRPAQPDSPAFDGLSPRRPSVDDGDRSRRQKFRQCVIVDGERVSPPTSPKEAPQDITALGAILALFQPGSDSGTDAVERALLKAVKNEEQRLEAMGEMFDAEARARLAWLLEQVGQELSRPDLVCAVDRVLYTISSPTRPLGRSPSTYKVSTPRNRLSHQHRPSVSSKPLSIVVPPREHAGIELEVGSPAMHPATIRTYGLCPGSSSPPISESDEDSLEFDATPTVTDYAFHTPPLRICRNLQGQSPLLHRRSALRHRNRHSPSTSTPSPTNTPSTSPNTTPTASPSPLSTPIIYQSSRTYTTSSLSPLIHAEAALKQPPLSPPASRLVHAL